MNLSISLSTYPKPYDPLMSRIPHENIWISYHYVSSYAPCPICQTIMDRDNHQTQPHGWNRAHIISTLKGGPDTLPNVRPICIKCNLKMKSDNLFIFLYKQNIITKQQAKELFNQHIENITKYQPICNRSNCQNRKSTLYFDQCNRHLPPTSSMEIDYFAQSNLFF